MSNSDHEAGMAAAARTRDRVRQHKAEEDARFHAAFTKTREVMPRVRPTPISTSQSAANTEIRAVRVVPGTFSLTTRDRLVSKFGSAMTFAPQPTSLEEALDNAAAIVARVGNDVVVWQDNRVAAVVSRHEDGRVLTTPFFDPFDGP